MKRVYIIGMGMGADSLTSEAITALNEVQLIIGASRLTDIFNRSDCDIRSAVKPQEIAEIIVKSSMERIAVLVSGDVGFYSGAKVVSELLSDCDIIFISGISSVNYFFAKCKLPWQNAKLISAHGRDCDIVSAVRRDTYVFALTGGNVSDLAQSLYDVGFGNLIVRVGENLGTSDEKIYSAAVSELLVSSCPTLTVLIIENPSADKRVRTGIPDSEFIRTGIPMTKSAVRAVTLSKLGLHESAVCYDIGCGTGSVTVEMALSAFEGKVFAFDKDMAAIGLTKENCRKFKVGNVQCICGSAPEIIDGYPAPDFAFIGGSSGKIADIVSALRSKNPQARIVINAVSPQTASNAIYALECVGLASDIVQVSTSNGRYIGSAHMMIADNPVYIISGGGAY